MFIYLYMMTFENRCMPIKCVTVCFQNIICKQKKSLCIYTETHSGPRYWMPSFLVKVGQQFCRVLHSCQIGQRCIVNTDRDIEQLAWPMGRLHIARIKSSPVTWPLCTSADSLQRNNLHIRHLSFISGLSTYRHPTPWILHNPGGLGGFQRAGDTFRDTLGPFRERRKARGL